MQKFSSLFTEDGDAAGALTPASPSNVSSDVATTGLQQKVTQDDLKKQRELEQKESFARIFSKTWNDSISKK
ncbi:hypothetical protein phiA829_056 [Aeromonas phage phiA8-29]|uniref:Uncharacterized protein n=1 Tax=Aeromonas phage phiA8-29 TaxID=1978922 RepID=A0A1W6DYD4_9CAUD|nr:hypothetical protein HWB15_gp057 [Aeromonas phage phiA8-29]ARK07876.1 hypothetical protein phiA829_056 [Aeromonas phage phiA8-29]